jgi:hypothetical protein
LNAPFVVDSLLAAHGLLDLIAIFMLTRWGIGFWNDLNAGANGRTASMMFFFFSLANYFISVFINVLLQLSFIPLPDVDSYRIVARLFNLVAFAVFLFVVALVDRKFSQKENDAN